MRLRRWSELIRQIAGISLASLAGWASSPADQARQHARDVERALRSAQRVLHAWLAQADPLTLLLPDRLPGGRGTEGRPYHRVYTPHNSGADLYPYLILTARITDPEIYHGRMLEMLRNEVRYTTVLDSLPADFDLEKHVPAQPSIFGAAEYAKDGLLAVTELLGRTPWFERMRELTRDMMRHCSVKTRWGPLPGTGAEINGDALQVLVRLAAMDRDLSWRQWARGIADAYVEEILPRSNGLPVEEWDFATQSGSKRCRLRDHGNEAIVGLTLLYALEAEEQTPYARRYEPAIRKMLDQVLASANPDGFLYESIDVDSLRPVRDTLSDNWGYVYGAVYAFFQSTGDPSYREATLKVLRALPKYLGHNWGSTSFDELADSIEGALYLLAREPVQEAFQWVEKETQRLMSLQRPDGFIERWYGEGNYNRTLLLYVMWKTQGILPDPWTPGLELGAARTNDGLIVFVNRPARVRFDFPRHRLVIGFRKNYARLNEFPEWYAVEPNWLYRLRDARGVEQVRLGSELVAGIQLPEGLTTVEPLGPPPYAQKASPVRTEH